MSEVKQVYLIRHAETLKNRQPYHQGPDEPLTERGREQVKDLIGLLRDKEINILISSPYRRAQETAELVGKALNLEYKTEASVREFDQPLSLYGRHHLSISSLRYFIDLYRHRFDLFWDREGAENVARVRERVKVARLMLEEHSGKNIAVISHRIFMTMFVETVCYDKPLSLYKFIRGLLGRKLIPNTTVLHMTLQKPTGKETCNWQLEETLLPPYNRELK
jgi:2,3-bisphosphoglycerate-dependent phosphoglycerate mutase